jgi:DHA2 family multidrug resistance protein-like MFS transporter
MTKLIPHDGLNGPQRYLAVMVISCATILTAMDSTLVNIALPTMMVDLQVSAASSVLIINASQIAMLVSLLPFSALGAIVGYRRVYLGGMMFFSLACIGCALSQTLEQIVVARAFQGIGAAGVVSVQHAMVRHVYPARLLGRGLGINTMFVASSSAIGPTVAAAVLSVASWPYIFVINIPLGILAFIIGWKVLPWSETAKEPYDFRSALMSALTFGLVVLAFDSFSHGVNPWITGLELVAALVIAPIFIRSQLDLPKPVLPLDVFGNRVIPLSLAAAQCNFIAQLLSFVTLPFYLHSVGFSDVQIGLVMTPWPLAIALMAPVSGYLCDRYPPGVIGTIGLLLCASGQALLAFLPAGAGVFDVAWRMALCGIGIGLFGPPNLRQIVGATPKHRTAAVGGMVGTNRLTGQSIGAALAALVLNVAPMNANVVALGIAAALTTIGACISLARAPLQIAARQSQEERAVSESLDS